MIVTAAAALCVTGCAKKKTTSALYRECTSLSLVSFLNKDTVLQPAGGSPHGAFRLKFNATAAGALDAGGRLPSGEKFPEGSVIVKEIMKNGQTELFAVMKRDPNSRFASHKWIWAEIDPTGGEIYSVSKRGDACTGCHSETPNRDLARSFDYH